VNLDVALHPNYSVDPAKSVSADSVSQSARS
jgi:hypothetical protein